jgi:integrase
LRRVRSNFLLTAGQKTDVRAALEILDGSGLTLEMAARLAVQGRRGVARATVGELAERFLLSRVRTVRAHTFAWYESKIGIFCADFANRDVNSIARADFRAWLAAQEVSESTRCAFARAVRAMWSWAARQEPPLAGQDVTAGVTVTADRPAVIGFLTPEEAAAAVRGIPPHYRPALALMLFAGVRPHEIAGLGKPRLPWAAVNPAERIVRIPAECAKTGRARVIEGLPEALWRWIGAPGKPSHPVSGVLTPAVVEKAAEAAGFGPRCDRVRKWPHDALRHTFATFAVALTADPGRVSLWLGHEGSVATLHRHYRGLATKADAERFWAI